MNQLTNIIFSYILILNMNYLFDWSVIAIFHNISQLLIVDKY